MLNLPSQVNITKYFSIHDLLQFKNSIFKMEAKSEGGVIMKFMSIMLSMVMKSMIHIIIDFTVVYQKF